MDNQISYDLSRRDFLKSTGIGVAALSFAGAGLVSNANAVSAETFSSETIETDVLVIGGGMAGTFAALKAKAQGVDVTIVDKGRVGKSGLSPFWGGTAAFDPEYGVSEEKMMQEIVKAEEYLSNKPYWNLWMKNSKKAFEDMVEIGMFEPIDNNRGPSRRKAVVAKEINLLERTVIKSLLKRDGRVVGAIGFPLDEEKAYVINAKAVIMCAGGGTFKTPGWPGHSMTHDGDAMAYRAGVEITGKEFVDYHTTYAEDPAGFGCTSGGAPSMDSATLVYPSIWTRGQLGDEQNAHAGKFPSTSGGGLDQGGSAPDPLGLPGGAVYGEMGARPDMSGQEPMQSVGGSAAGSAPHKCEGIVPLNDKCETQVEGLYAAGDSLCTFGACYGVGCTSSMNSAVQGSVAGEVAAEFSKTTKRLRAKISDVNKAKTEMLAPRQATYGFSPRWVTQVLQGIMVPYYVLSVKEETRLKAALSTIEFLRDKYGDNLLANNSHELRLAHETKNMLLNAEMRLKAGLLRTESRGSHFREDYPARDDKNWLAWIVISADGDEMKLTKREIPEEWKPSEKLSYKEKYPYTRFLGEEEYLKGQGIKFS
jgi:succinate dehydrogenase/fumarate reductase flavoprotein subunit